MRHLLSVLGLLTVGFTQLNASAAEVPEDATKLNNDGLLAIKSGNRQVGFEKLRAALNLDPSCVQARINLAITHGLYGLELRNTGKLSEALSEFQRAAFINPQFGTEVDATILIMGKSPDSFADRVELAERARANKDYVGAAVEYTAALNVKDDVQVSKQLAEVYQLLDTNAKTEPEYRVELPSPSKRADWLLGYKSRVTTEVRERWVIPTATETARHVVLSLSINSRGDLVDVYVKDSSGSPILDGSAVKAAKAVGGFQALPRWVQNPLTIEVNCDVVDPRGPGILFH